MFLGDELTEILEAIESGTDYQGRVRSDLAIGVHVLPKFPKDTTDRNRTSPFAFTGNKFEFRSLGASASISEANVVLNTIVAESLRQFADELEQAADFESALHKLIVRTIRDHKRIIFNGNNYSESWVAEAEKRGLLNLPSTVDALPYMVAEKNIEVFSRHRVYSETEIRSRYEVRLESYTKVLNIEAETMLMMAQREILPAVTAYTGKVAASAAQVRSILPDAPLTAQEKLVRSLCEYTAQLSDVIDVLKHAIEGSGKGETALASAQYEHDVIIPAMNSVRAVADELETLVGRNDWPFPTYTDLLFGV